MERTRYDEGGNPETEISFSQVKVADPGQKNSNGVGADTSCRGCKALAGSVFGCIGDFELGDWPDDLRSSEALFLNG